MPILLLKIFIGLESHYPPTQIKGEKNKDEHENKKSRSEPLKSS